MTGDRATVWWPNRICPCGRSCASATSTVAAHEQKCGDLASCSRARVCTRESVELEPFCTGAAFGSRATDNVMAFRYTHCNYPYWRRVL